MKNLTIAVVALLMVFGLSACSSGNDTSSDPSPAPAESSAPAPESGDSIESESEMSSVESTGEVIVEFDFEKQSGHASNQFAVWVEDVNGNLIKTLYATKYTANGGYKDRPDSIHRWVAKSELATMDKSQVDAITSATPKQGPVSYTWDLTDMNGDKIQPGEYVVFVEGSLRWRNSVLFSGNIEVGDSPVTVQASSEYYYESADGQDALTSDSPENSMLQDVTIRFIPEEI